ncbi:MAG: hypothetical protein RBR66_03235, partial [Candidatus Izemoplasmatales bacterium]|nr:hypothetical protein [Candidatus Izemoplasmatales bacterium]
MKDINEIYDAFILVKDGIIEKIGQGDYKKYQNHKVKMFDANNSILIPGLIDSHTHLVFGGSREHEFAKKIAGVDYLEILKQGGGILSTVKATQEAT